jgi:hypothetical protein
MTRSSLAKGVIERWPVLGFTDETSDASGSDKKAFREVDLPIPLDFGNAEGASITALRVVGCSA